MNSLYTIEEVANLLEVSPRKVRWLIFIGKLKASKIKGSGVIVDRLDIAEFVYNNPEYKKALRDKFGWHIDEYFRVREYHNTGKFPMDHKYVVYKI